MADPNWIEKATSKNKGSFRKQAKGAGMSTRAYAEKEEDNPKASSKTRKRARLAETLMKMRKG